MLLPLMMTLYLGGGRGVAGRSRADRKVTLTARTIGDLVVAGRRASTHTDMTNIAQRRDCGDGALFRLANSR